MDKRKTDFDLPSRHEPHTDKYFLRSKEILVKEDINPFVRYQVFIRKGPGVVQGIDETIAATLKFSPKLAEHGGRIYALEDGNKYESCETLMFIDGPVQDLVELETLQLSILSQRTSEANGMPEPDLEKTKNTASEITDIIEKSRYGVRPCSYFGARHFGCEWDAQLARAAYDGGFTSASTDIGAGTFGRKGNGTTPHALMLSFASKYGIRNYAAEVMKAFDKHIDPSVPRAFLADTFNREITDTLSVAEALGETFWGPRFDTNGAVVAEGGVPGDTIKYWNGKGVTIFGVGAARKAYNEAGSSNLNLALTSGFSNPRKVAEFVKAEYRGEMKLFDFVGAGFADNRYTATSDIMGYNENGTFRELHKVGRPIRPNPRLKEVNLGDY